MNKYLYIPITYVALNMAIIPYIDVTYMGLLNIGISSLLLIFTLSKTKK